MSNRLLASLRLAFWAPKPPRSREEVEKARRRVARSVVMQKATGNVRLQRGEYSTREDIDREYEYVKELRFDA